jgi:hypothetical protein
VFPPSCGQPARAERATGAASSKPARPRLPRPACPADNKALFGRQQNASLLVGLLNGRLALSAERRIESVQIFSPLFEVESAEEKHAVLDLSVVDARGNKYAVRGSHVDVEAPFRQRWPTENMGGCLFCALAVWIPVLIAVYWLARKAASCASSTCAASYAPGPSALGARPSAGASSPACRAAGSATAPAANAATWPARNGWLAAAT